MGLPKVQGSITLPEVARRLKLDWYLWDIDHLNRLIQNAP
jgi:hypothetical protein